MYNIIHSSNPVFWDSIQAGRVDNRSIGERCLALQEVVEAATGAPFSLEDAESFIRNIEEFVETQREKRNAEDMIEAIREATGETVSREHALAVLDDIMAELAGSVDRVMVA